MEKKAKIIIGAAAAVILLIVSSVLIFGPGGSEPKGISNNASTNATVTPPPPPTNAVADFGKTDPPSQEQPENKETDNVVPGNKENSTPVSENNENSTENKESSKPAPGNNENSKPASENKENSTENKENSTENKESSKPASVTVVPHSQEKENEEPTPEENKTVGKGFESAEVPPNGQNKFEDKDLDPPAPSEPVVELVLERYLPIPGTYFGTKLYTVSIYTVTNFLKLGLKAVFIDYGGEKVSFPEFSTVKTFATWSKADLGNNIEAFINGHAETKLVRKAIENLRDRDLTGIKKTKHSFRAVIYGSPEGMKPIEEAIRSCN